MGREHGGEGQLRERDGCYWRGMFFFFFGLQLHPVCETVHNALIILSVIVLQLQTPRHFPGTHSLCDKVNARGCKSSTLITAGF